MEVRGQLHALVALPPGKNPVLLENEDGWATEPVWSRSGESNTRKFSSNRHSAKHTQVYVQQSTKHTKIYVQQTVQNTRKSTSNRHSTKHKQIYVQQTQCQTYANLRPTDTVPNTRLASYRHRFKQNNPFCMREFRFHVAT